jgi:uncharacterized membrane protein
VNANWLRVLAGAALMCLIVLCLAWELWLAPLRPGGSWIALKALPLLIPLRGIVSGGVYTHRWLTMLVLAYAAEGSVRIYGDHGAARLLAGVEIGLALVIFCAAIGYVRAVRRTISPALSTTSRESA